MKIIMKILPVNHGDAILLKIISETTYNIFIDSGFKGTYKNAIKPEIKKIIENEEKINLFLITHVDQDHIGGLIALLKDQTLNWKNIIEKVWFNYYEENIYLNFTNKISYSQGVDLKELLDNSKILNDEILYFEGEKRKIENIEVILLSPQKNDIEKFLRKMKRVESSRKISASTSDYSQSIEYLFNTNFTENLSLENLSSLAFVIKINDVNILFGGDASSEIMLNSLIKLGFSKKKS